MLTPTVIPSEVEESRCNIVRFCHGLPRLRFAALGMITATSCLTWSLVWETIRASREIIRRMIAQS
jgi:hypothetical protein